MAGRAVAEHLALMARSGLMTHVAELDPPVTAATMARFRADAATQSSNVMALSPGEFALCLGPTVRELVSSIPHRLRPIAEHPLLDPDHGVKPRNSRAASADLPDAERSPAPPRRILPPSLRGEGLPPPPAATAARAGGETAMPEPPSRPSAAERAAPVVPDPMRQILSGLAEGQCTLAAHLDRLASLVESAEAGRDASRQALEDQMQEIEHRVIHHLGDEVSALGDRIAEALDGAIGKMQDDAARDRQEQHVAQDAKDDADRTALRQEIMDAFTIADAARHRALAPMQEEIQSLGLARAEDEARMTEGFATLRLGLRAMNDRLADLGARIAPEQTAAHAPEPAPEAFPEEKARMGARLAVLHPDAPVADGAAVPDPAKTVPRTDLRSALRLLLEELYDAPPSPRDAPSAHGLPDHAQRLR